MKKKIVSFKKLSDIFFVETHNNNQSKSIEIAQGLWFSRMKNHKWMNSVVRELMTRAENSLAILNVDRHLDAYSQITTKNKLGCGNWVNSLKQFPDMNFNVFQLYPEWFLNWQVLDMAGPKFYDFKFMDNSIYEVFKRLAEVKIPTIITVDYDYFILNYEYIGNSKERPLVGKVIEEIPSWDYGSLTRARIRDSRDFYGVYSDSQVNKEVKALFEGLMMLPLKQVIAINITTSNEGVEGNYIDESRLASLENMFQESLQKYIEWRARR